MLVENGNLAACICGREHGSVSSFFHATDIKLGLIILAVLTFVLLLIARDALLVLAILGLIAYVILFCLRILKKHSVNCGARWAVFTIVGAVGGFGIFG
jgi:hypothetical protein